MPNYEFKCLDCGKAFEIPLSLTDFEAGNYQCPSCNQKNLEEQFTNVSVISPKKS
jgi:putative FmdB family regulatory protein